MQAPTVFDRRAYAARRARAAGTENFLAHDVAEVLAERLGTVNRSFGLALDLSTRPCIASKIAPFAHSWLRTGLSQDAITAAGACVVADEEFLPFPARRFDLIVSALSLQAVNDLPGALLQIRHALAPDGFFLAALFGGATLVELRRSLAAGENDVLGGASPRVAPFAQLRDMAALLQRAGFVMPVADSETLHVRYRSFFTLAGDLRALGETNVLAERSRNPLRRDVLSAALAHYGANHRDEAGTLLATFEILYLAGWAPANAA
ncbi:MAG TPA: methyltransferase domain-containing protein [Rhizomicrobium sp.]|jgi:SAM-dependent methyltransferase